MRTPTRSMLRGLFAIVVCVGVAWCFTACIATVAPAASPAAPAVATAVPTVPTAASALLAERNKAVVRRNIEEVWNKRDMTVVDEIYDSSFGPADVKQFITDFLTAFPDWHITIDDMIAEGDKVAIILTERGTQKGTFQGIAPTGKQVKYTAINVYQIANGKIVGFTTDEGDLMPVLQQLGALVQATPPPSH